MVTLNGRDIYLGKWNSRESRAEYDRLMGEWFAAGRCLPVAGTDLTIAEMALRYWQFAKGYYRQNGHATSSLERVKTPLRLLRESYAHTPARAFGPLALQALQGKLVSSGLCRPYINRLVEAVKRVFRWAVSQELLPETVYRALASVPGLRVGRTEAPEPKAIGPVDTTVVDATLPYLPPIVADMVRLQQATGCRPAEVCMIRLCDLDTTGDTWVYTPAVAA